MPTINECLLPLEEGPIHFPMPNGTGRTIRIPAATRIPTGPGQTAIRIEFPEVEASYACTVIIEDQVLMPGNGYSWKNGIHLTNAWYAKLHRIHIHGAGGYLEMPSMENGVILDGRSNSVSISAYHAMGMMTPLFITGKSEATRLVDYEFIGTYHGVVAFGDQYCPGLSINHGHIRASSAAFLFNNQVQFSINDALVYGDNGFTQTNGWPFYPGLMLSNCFDGVFNNIKVGAVDPAKVIASPLIIGGERIIQNNVVRLPF